MIDEFKEVFTALDNPSMKHAIFGHLPIALCVLLVPLTLAAAILHGNRTCRITALCAFGVLLIASFLTVNSGEHAEAAIDKVLSPEVYELLERHEELAEKLWFFAIAGIVLLGAAEAIARPAVRTLGLWLAFATSIGAVGWVSLTAHQGGTLVYGHGVGTPNPVTCDQLNGVTHDSTQPQSAETTNGPAEFFTSTVFPILSEHCFKCHNPAKVAARKSGRLDLTTRETMLKGGASGAPIQPGRPEESLLFRKITHADPDEIMPPDEPLSAEQIAAIEQWIRDGAVWE